MGTYNLDFAILDKKIDLEIDGDQHYLDSRIVEHDKKRTQFLEENGWTVLRIRWSDYKKIESKKSFVDEIIRVLS